VQILPEKEKERDRDRDRDRKRERQTETKRGREGLIERDGCFARTHIILKEKRI